jgi:hypothetical protein
MRAFQSQGHFWQGFWAGRSAFLENGHFKNVQNRFLKFKPGKIPFFYLFNNILFSINGILGNYTLFEMV